MELTKKQWAMVAAGAGAIAGLAARKAAATTWEHFTDQDAPTVQDAPDTAKLLLWAGASAVVAALASTSAQVAVHSMREDTDLGPANASGKVKDG